jgi:GH15 family glucan-1,4-alpha-glucosidase
MAGDVSRARDVFATAVAARNDVNLLAEEYGDEQLLGNFPQAFSHVGLVNAAWAIAEAERAGPSDERPTEHRSDAGDVA